MISHLQVRRTRDLPPEDVSIVKGIPVTSVARTLLNLASILPPVEYGRTFLEADRLGLIDERELMDILDRSNGHRGVGKFRLAVLRRIPGVEGLRSVLEGLFLELCRDQNIPMPETNLKVGSYEVDCLWRRQRLIVELDGYEFHRGLEKFEQDADRSSELRAQGWSVMRLTWRMVTGEPDVVGRRVREALRASPLRPTI